MARSIVWTPISRSTRPHHRLQRSVLESRRTHLLFRRQLVGRNLGLRLRPRHGCRVQQAHVLQNRSFAGRRRRRRTLQDGTHPQRNNQGVHAEPDDKAGVCVGREARSGSELRLRCLIGLRIRWRTDVDFADIVCQRDRSQWHAAASYCRRGRWRNSNLWGCRRGYRQRGRRPIRHFDQGRCPISGLPPASQDVAFGIVILIAVALTTDRAKIGIVK